CVLAASALVIVHELPRSGLTDVDVGAASEMLSGDLAHRRPPGLRAPLRSRRTGLRAVSRAAVSWSATARRRAALDRTDPAASFRASRLFEALPSSPAFESNGSEARSASISVRSDCNNVSENVGDSCIVNRAADSFNIHAGRNASEPSG